MSLYNHFLLGFTLFNIKILSFAVLLLFAALLMELAAQTSRGINCDTSHVEEELSPIRLFLYSFLHSYMNENRDAFEMVQNSFLFEGKI
jgi:hypothetical protein